jgi:hypothetical protein
MGAKGNIKNLRLQAATFPHPAPRIPIFKIYHFQSFLPANQ